MPLAKHWTDGMKAVARIYPSAISSKNWPDIVALANAGDIVLAKELAAKGEMHPHVRARNILARAIRNHRVELFTRIARAETALRALLDTYQEKLIARFFLTGGDGAKLPGFNELLHSETVALRAALRIWVAAGIRDAARMGFAHPGQALLPIFKASMKEALTREILAEQALFEARLTFPIKKALAGRGKPTVSMGDDKWAAATARIIRNITKKNLAGLNPSERVWDLTTRAEQDLKRIVASGMAAGDNPAVTARKIRKYIAPEVTDASKLGIELGSGVYRSPYKNAMRLARTEMNRTYAQASAAFAQDKPWIVGLRPTLSPVHSIVDECDDGAAGPLMTAAEFASTYPIHPHCMCYATYEIDPKYLGEEEAA